MQNVSHEGSQEGAHWSQVQAYDLQPSFSGEQALVLALLPHEAAQGAAQVEEITVEEDVAGEEVDEEEARQAPRVEASGGKEGCGQVNE